MPLRKLALATAHMPASELHSPDADLLDPAAAAAAFPLTSSMRAKVMLADCGSLLVSTAVLGLVHLLCTHWASTLEDTRWP
eukprot:SAG31_NODE_8560_length_1430_cov_2.035312_1_plen_80_part_10